MGSAQTYLKIERKKREKAKYENRKSQVESVRGNISPVADDNVEAINKKIGDVVSELGNALNGIPTETMQSNLNAFKQKYASSDEKLTSATSYLNSEVGDCNNKINELNIEIANLQRQYEAEKAAEEAARRAAEEAARKAAQEAAQKLTNLLRK